MSLPACFVRAADAGAALPITVVAREAYADWLPAQDAALQAWLKANDFKASAGAWVLAPNADGTPRGVVAVVADGDDPHALSHLPALLPPGDYCIAADSPLQPDPSALALGWGLGAYRFERYVPRKRPPSRLAVGDGVDAALAVLRASLRVRDLVNTPTEHMGPAELEDAVRELAQARGARFNAVIGDELLARNFPTIHAVGRASHRPPRLLELEWGDPSHPRVAIVGKGVCFDTGGLDIKASDGMRNMKKDMGGAAHAIALAQLVMELRLPVRLQLLVPAVENAIAGNAYRPGEVIVTRKGLSVEVDNTDAEGRLVLCDALAYAAEQSPALVLDFATLTGAARIALGPDVPALFCNDEALAADYLAAAQRARDPLWRMPLWRPYLSFLKSHVADLANAGASRQAGAITAALYLERFVPEQLPWAHVDVYAWNDGDRPGRPAGGEAQGLRAALALLQQRFPAKN